MSARLDAHIATTVAACEELASEWDDLAAAAGRPTCLSAWQLAWWRQLAPPGAELRVICVRDQDGRLVGLAPTYLHDGALRMLASEVAQRVEPLADPAVGVTAVAPVVADALARHVPEAERLVLHAVDAGAGWLDALRRAWPVRPAWGFTELRAPAPVIHANGDGYDAWLAGRSRNFRKQARRFRRRLEEAGGTVRATRTLDELERDVAEFVRLHHARWERRGGSSLGRDIGAMLCDAGQRMLPAGQLRIWIVELDGRAVSADVYLAAGATALAWNAGFDESAARLRPALVGFLAGIEDCFEGGALVVDLGAGEHDYKLRLADGDAPLAWSVLVPRGPRYLANRVALLPRQTRARLRDALAALPPGVRDRLRGLHGRLRGRR